MTDIREAILARLLAIGEELDVFTTVARDLIEVTDSQLPALVVLEGDEEANDSDPFNRPTTSPRRVTMTPELHIAVQEASADIGAELGSRRAALIKAIVSDTALQGLVINGIGIRYRGLASSLAAGRKMTADMGLNFAFTYVLKPDEL